MSSNACLSLLLDGPMQSWGHESRFERRATATHPTRSAIIGMIAAACGISKDAADERAQLARFADLRITTVSLPRLARDGSTRKISLLEDYHTVSGLRKADGRIELSATAQTYRGYLEEARFAALLEGPVGLLSEIAVGLRNPCWGLWLGRKSCVPAAPVVMEGQVAEPLSEAWALVLRRAGYRGNEAIEAFDRVVEVAASEPGAFSINDAPVCFGADIGFRHRVRWVAALRGGG